MEARFEVRKQELLDECKVAPEVFAELNSRLEAFMDPFLDSFCRREQNGHMRTYLRGLL